MLKNTQDKFISYIFSLVLASLTIFALSKFNSFMDNYEIIILIGSAITFAWMGNVWLNFRTLFS